MTPLVLVHGFMGGSGQWAAQAPLSATRRVIAVDLPGFGCSAESVPLDRIEDFATWVLNHLDMMKVERFDLLGHSMGGMVVQEMARQAKGRVRKLVLYSTGSEGVLPGRFETIETSMERALRDGAEATARRIAATWFLHGEAAAGFPAVATIAAQVRLPAVLAGLEAMKAWSGSEKLSAIAARTLIIWGDHDRTYPWAQIETLWRQIPDSHLSVVPDCAHAVHAERPRMFNLLLEEFLMSKTQPNINSLG